MSTDKSVQNQKVFVTLESVLQFQSDYHQLIAEQQKAEGSELQDKESRRHAYESVILTFHLPVAIQPWLPRTKGGQS